MKSYNVIGYAYDADLHCLDCTARQFPEGTRDYQHDQFDQTIDSEGNPLHAIFTDESHNPNDGTPYACRDCFRTLIDDELPAWVASDPDHYRALTGLEV